MKPRIKQYPYRLEVLSQTEAQQDPVTGDWLPGGQIWQFICNCRDEAGNGKEQARADGTKWAYAFLIQMPKGTEAILSGTQVRVKDESDNIRASGTVTYSRKYQLHTRAWV